MEIKPIAHFRSPFATKFGIPRQAGLAGVKGRIVFEPEYRSPEAVRGLEDFDYIWLIWEFSRVSREGSASTAGASGGIPGCGPGPAPGSEPADKTSFRATVRPPRLGGNERVGVFASRSPFRPNRLGLSSVRLVSVDYDSADSSGAPLGPVINVVGADLMDGTPVYDIKPYLAYADSHEGARSGFVDSVGWKPLEVVFPDGALSSGLDLGVLSEVLSLDPRPAYSRQDPDRLYGMAFGGHDIRFKVEGNILRVVDIV